MPKDPDKPGQAKSGKEKPSNAVPSAQADTVSSNTAPAATNTTSAASTASAASARTNQSSQAKKPGDAPKPIEVIFLSDNGKAKMLPVKRGISDDTYTEILEGVQGEQEVVSGGYKAINRELEDGKKIKIGPAKGDKDKKEEK
jgi:HlyD family secretion protein